MFGFLGFIFIILLVIILFAFAILGNLVRFIFGLGKSTPKRSNNQTSAGGYTQTSTQDTYTEHGNTKKKIFGKDEGEYVEFEEVN